MSSPSTPRSPLPAGSHPVADVVIRDASVEDAPGIRAIYEPFVRETAVSFELRVPDVPEIASRIARTMERHPYLVATRADTALGYAYAGPLKERAAYDLSVEVTVYIADSARRTGVGRRLYEVLFDRLRADGYHSATAIIALPNEGSVGLHEAMGFRHVGTLREIGRKFERWHDCGWWQLML